MNEEEIKDHINALVKKSIEQGWLTHEEKEFLAEHEDQSRPIQHLACFINLDY